MMVFLDMYKTISNLFWMKECYFFIFAISLLFLWMKRKEIKETSKVMIIYVAWFLVLILWNPIIYGIMMKTFFTGAAEVVRIYIILPVTWITAYAITVFLSGIKGGKRILGIIAVLLCFFFVGRTVSDAGWITKPTNAYKIKQDALESAEHILEDIEDKRVVAFIQDDGSKFTYGGNVWQGIRQYTSRVIPIAIQIPDEESLSADRESVLALVKSYHERVRIIEEDIEKEHFYMVVQKEMAPIFSEVGGKILGETEGYVIVRF